MKAGRMIAAAVVSGLVICGCGGGSELSSKAQAVAKQAVEVADGYLDGELDYDAASEVLDELDEEMEYVYGNEDPNMDDMGVSSDISLLSHAILMDDLDETSESYDEVVDKRNDIANAAGIAKR